MHKKEKPIVKPIDPNSLQPQEFLPEDEALIPSIEVNSLFNPTGS